MKRILALLLSLLLLLSLSACTKSAAGKEIEIWFVTPLYDHPVFNVAQEGFEQAAKDLGFKSNFVGPKKLNAEEMNSQIELAIKSGVGGFATLPISHESMGETFAKCDKAGLAYIFANSDDPQANAIASVGTNERILGNQGAEEILKHFDGAPIYGMIMMAMEDNSNALGFYDGYMEVLEKAENFTLVDADFCNSDTQTAMDKFAAAFEAHPEINCIIGVCSEAGPAAAKVCEEKGITDKVTILAVDDIPETLEMIRSGLIWGTMAQNYYQIGYKTGAMMYEYLKNGTKPSEYFVDSGCAFVSLDNIDTYAEAFR